MSTRFFGADTYNFCEEGVTLCLSMALRFDKVQLISIRDKLGERSSSNESKYERIVGACNHRADQRK